MNFSVLSWNVRGFGRKEKIKAARDLLAKVKPNVGFFQEMKLEQVNENFSRKLWGNLNRCVIFSPAIRSAGGLISTWDPYFFNVSDRIINRRFIGLVGSLRDGNHSIGFVNVYGPSTDSEKKEFFEELSKLVMKYNIAWVVGGDFNAYLNPEEKLGFSFNSFLMRVFKEFVGNIQGIDLPLCGGAFTWCNNRDPPTFVRLDRFIVTADVILKFPNISQVLLTKALSDHNAILIHSAPLNWGPKPFKFFNYWLRKEGFDDLMTSVFSKFSSDGNSRGIGGLLRESKKAIKTWAKSQCQDRKVSIYNLEANINELEVKIQTSALPPSTMNQVGKLRAKLWKLYREEEHEWLQKSRLRWFTEGDRNTRFFHIAASLRRKKNQILCLTVGNRSLSDPRLIKEAIKNHFSLEYNNGSTLEVETMNLPFTKLRPEQASQLESMFSEEEVWAVIRDSDVNRAPGPDDFNMSFFKRYWELIKVEFMKFFRDFYHTQHFEASLNHSFITLIPKKSNPESLDEYRPISLLNCAYKILTSVLGRRLRQVSDHLVSKSQFAFIQGRQILDCSLIANEVIDSVYKSGASGVAFKIDFKKAYDSVDWNFLLKIMEEMGFGVRWRRWIHQCVSTASISVLVNGAPTERFSISKGIRQGCPLSPLLFNLVGEALSLMLNKAMAVGLFSGIQIGNNSNSVIISHLQFADDLMVFCEASGLQVLAVKMVLRDFELASGLGLNLKKSRVFGLNVDQASIQSWANAIGCSMSSLPTEYLGLPLGVRHNSIKLWEPILKKLSSKSASWKSQFLSFGGRISLVKSVLSSLPMFFMSLFRMPVAVSKRITCMVSNFLWGGMMDKKQIHWVNWSLLCQSVENGGLGLMDFDLQNRCLLGKWVWRFSAENDSLWKKVIQSKHKRGDLALSLLLYQDNLLGCGKVPSWNELLTMLANFHSSGLGRDWLQWIGSSDGLYSIKSMKAQLSLVPTSVVNWKKVVWIGLAPPKVEAFMWLILHERVPVKVELLKRGVSVVADDSCPLCNQARETVEHLFSPAACPGNFGRHSRVVGVFPWFCIGIH
ncbi:hypothetical protein GQ457_01G004750 [Hibiscus cannabinus]